MEFLALKVGKPRPTSVVRGGITCIGVNGWAFFGCMSALSLLLGNEFITTFSIVMFITSSGAALIGCLLHIVKLLIDKIEKRRQRA